MRKIAARWLDPALMFLAFCLGLAHLHFPLGREHSMAAYVGLEWLRGASPYAHLDSVDGPGLLLVHGVLRGLGCGDHGFRVLALVVVLATGWLASLLVLPRGDAAPPGVRGVAVLVASLLAHGYFDFWHAARGGTFAMLAWLGAAVLIRRSTFGWRAAVGAGALATFGASTLLQTLPYLALLTWLLLAEHGRDRRLVAFAGGAIGMAVLLLLAMGPAGSRAAYDMLIRGRCLYFNAEYIEMPAVRITEQFKPLVAPTLGMFTLAWLLAGANERAATRSRRLVVGWGLCGYLSLRIVGSFAPSENELFVSFGALLATRVALDLAEWFAHKPARSSAVLALAIVSLYALAYPEADASSTRCRERQSAYWSGLDSLDTFTVADIGFYPVEIAAIAGEVKQRMRDGERIVVRGYEPAVYLLSGSHYGGRFFTTGHLQWPGCAYRREEWLVRDERELASVAPRWVVSVDVAPGLDAPASFERRGYRIETRTEHFVLMQRQ